MQNSSPYYSRRDAIRLGVTAIGFTAFARVIPAIADDVISKAKIVPEGGTVSGAKLKKAGPYRIGFSNGFSGNTWRTQCLYSLKKEAGQHKEIADLIVVDGQGDITKQVSDIENLVSQNVDAILCIPNSGPAVIPALQEATKQGSLRCRLIFRSMARLGRLTTERIREQGSQLGNGSEALSVNRQDRCTGRIARQFVHRRPGPARLRRRARSRSCSRALGRRPRQSRNGEHDRGISADRRVSGAMIHGSQPGLVPVTGGDYNGLLKLFDRGAANQPKF
jgi:hypothetical protein